MNHRQYCLPASKYRELNISKALCHDLVYFVNIVHIIPVHLVPELAERMLLFRVSLFLSCTIIHEFIHDNLMISIVQF